MGIFSVILSILTIMLNCIELIGIYLLLKDKYEQEKNNGFGN